MLESFQDQFWLDEHHWFVGCDRDLSFGRTLFYTIPYSFKDFTFSNTTISKWTRSQTNNRWFYNGMRSLTYEFLNDEYPSHQILFLNIQHLLIVLPIDEHFWSSVLKFDELISLTIIFTFPNEDCGIQLQSLLDRAYHLSKLHIDWS
ncbi:unnamed protein product [Rotaria sp. Silwood1]|nr:unnamed protein product [Rotaria sp. Silwood1]CAF1599066.1 unnamed protein product [Rotaria sp. Silwood1]CAF3773954.1 unnamed protein product [Rotaria sp. Silwood1]CAF4700790.1 unnamed protein product [Rotaria sp. Silwood1]CAF4855631.1 unnamed protein product [Rotaria sp. Silwood1]